MYLLQQVWTIMEHYYHYYLNYFIFLWCAFFPFKKRGLMQSFFLKCEVLPLKWDQFKETSFPSWTGASLKVHEANLKLCLFNTLSPWHQKGFGAVKFLLLFFFVAILAFKLNHEELRLHFLNVTQRFGGFLWRLTCAITPDTEKCC